MVIMFFWHYQSQLNNGLLLVIDVLFVYTEIQLFMSPCGTVLSWIDAVKFNIIEE